MPLLNANYTALPVSTRLEPCDDPKSIPVIFRILWNETETGDVVFDVDLSQSIERGQIEYIQTVFIDNSQSASPITLTAQGTQQAITIDGGEQAYLPFLLDQNAKFTVTTNSATIPEGLSILVQLQLLNVHISPAVW